MLAKLIVTLAAVASYIKADVYFNENFNDPKWESRWVTSSWKPEAEIGKFEQVTGKYYDDSDDKGIKTSQDARFYVLSAKLEKPFNNKDKDLYISYLVQHEQHLDCGGAYLKLLPKDTDQSKFGGDSKYSIMFGPDICGSVHKTHVIMNYARPKKDAVNMDHKTNIDCESDSDPHLYSFVLKKDNTYDILIDGKSVQSGKLEENWPFLPEKEIKDPKKSKPDDWVDDKKIPDPEDKKPEGWDDIPKTIPDPDAKKPEDWDDEDDGEWEPAMIENPEYKGEWKPKIIDNPDYKGEWEHPMIPNPDYFEDDSMYNVAKDVGAVGFEIWQVKSGTLFDDIFIADDEAEFKKHEKEVLAKIERMNKKKEEIQKEEATKAEAAAEAEKKADEEKDKKDDDKDDAEESEKDEDEEGEPEKVVEVDEKDEL